MLEFSLSRAYILSSAGMFINGTQQGKGTLNQKDGSVYNGNFFSGEFNDDMATLTLPDRSFYKGSFRRSRRNGQGILTGADGKIIYEGKWVGDKFCGGS